MVKSVGKRFLSIALVIVMVLTLLPVIEMSASAANVNTGVTGLAAESSGDATWTSSGGTITGRVAAKKDSGCTGDTFTARTGTLTFTNSSGGVRMLSFDYTPAPNSGSVKIDDAAVDASAAFSKKLAAGETVTVELTSNAANETPATISIKNIKLTEERDVTLTFKAASHGSYTVDGAAISAETTKTVKTTDVVAFAATPAKNYKLLGWYNTTTGACLSTATTVSLSFTENATIEPRFIASSVPLFKVGGNIYSDLNEAIGYANSSGSSTIILISSGTLPAGNYTIPNGKTLLIPFDAAYTVFTTEPEVVYGSHVNPSAYVTLTMAGGANITVASGGAISVPAKLSATGTGSGSWNGTPTGKYGHIKMSDGSKITVQNRGSLYCYGYISGSGSVEALSGATVWEAMQFRCWRGGTATSGMRNGVFPMSQYYVQNIETPLTLNAGATEKVYTSVNASNSAQPASATFIGEGGMFRINSGSVTKRFDGPTDRLVIDVNGDVNLSSLSLNLTITLDTSVYVLPINSNITIRVHSGTTTIDSSQDVAFLPGSVLEVDQGATVSVGSEVYVYDQEQWGPYAAAGQQLVVVGYSVANGTTAKRNASSLVDAKFDVNGTLTVSGALYTTSSGAEIVSSGKTGKVVLTKAAPGDTSTQQATQSDRTITKVNIPVTSAQLKNGVADPQFTATAGSAANTTFSYCAVHDKWEQDTGSQTVTFNANATDAQGIMDSQQTCPAGSVTLNANTFTREGYDFTGWNTKADGTGDSYTDGQQNVTFSQNTTLYAQWKSKTYKVTWVDENGNVLKELDEVAYGTTVSASECPDPTMEPDEYSYTFIGWDQENAVVNGNVTFTAHFDKTMQQYDVDLIFRVDGIPDESAGTTKLYDADKSMKLTATDTYKTNGVTYYFDHWEFVVDESTTLSFQAKSITVRPSQGGHFTAYAVYSATEKTDFEPILLIIRDKTVGTKLVKTLSYSIPDGYTLKAGSVGFTVEDENGTEIGSAFSEKLGANNYGGKTGVYTVTIPNMTSGAKVIAHITYLDSDGTEHPKTAQ